METRGQEGTEKGYTWKGLSGHEGSARGEGRLCRLGSLGGGGVVWCGVFFVAFYFFLCPLYRSSLVVLCPPSRQVKSSGHGRIIPKGWT